ncbi:MAG: hypothetical protein ABIE25_03060 [Thermoplasmatota archaeon]
MKKSLGRPNLGKTETIKQRAVTIYLPTEEMVDKWKEKAKEYSEPLSRFVVEVVDDAIRRNPSGLTPRENMEAELQQAKTENRKLAEKIQSLETALKQRDLTVAEYRTKREDAVDFRDFKAGLTEVADMIQTVDKFFRNNESLPMNEAYDKLGIRQDDASKQRALRASMTLLIWNGLVEKGMTEWRWIGGGRRKGHRSAKER